VDLKGVRCQNVDRIKTVKHGRSERSLVNPDVKLCSIRDVKFINQLINRQILEKDVVSLC
jgi:hypothetical protein